jgi:hypothetical protein
MGSGSSLRRKGAAPATIADRLGYEAILDDGRGKLSHLLDIVAAGDRIYLLISAGPKDHATSDEAKRFRDSFRLLAQVQSQQGQPQQDQSPSAANPPSPQPNPSP